MKRESEVLGLPVVERKNGNKIASIKHAIYSEQKYKIIGFLVNGGNFFSHPKVIKYKNIEFIGNDAVMIKDKKVIDDVTSIPEIDTALKNDFKIIGDEVLTDDGESLGIVHDVVFDHSSGRILGFILTNGIFQDLMEGRNILPFLRNFTIGEETVMIPGGFKSQFDKNKESFKKLLELE